VQAEKGILHHVIRSGLITDEQKGEPDKRQAVSPVQVLDRLAGWLSNRRLVPDGD
jgi:hypothetical protein